MILQEGSKVIRWNPDFLTAKCLWFRSVCMSILCMFFFRLYPFFLFIHFILGPVLFTTTHNNWQQSVVHSINYKANISESAINYNKIYIHLFIHHLPLVLESGHDGSSLNRETQTLSNFSRRIPRRPRYAAKHHLSSMSWVFPRVFFKVNMSIKLP